MSSYGQQFLSKVIDSGDLSAFTRCGITREHFVTAAEKKRSRLRFWLRRYKRGPHAILRHICSRKSGRNVHPGRD